MDAMTCGAAAGDDRAVRFTGSWREYLPIAATNALLIIFTLGIYASGRPPGSAAICGRAPRSSTTAWNGPAPARKCSSAS